MGKPTVIADSGLLPEKNIAVLESEEYEYIIGTRQKLRVHTAGATTWSSRAKQATVRKNGNATVAKSIFARNIATVRSIPDKQIPHGRLGSILKIYSVGQTPNRERQNLENRA